MKSELPMMQGGCTGNARIAPDMRMGATVYDAPDTDELAEIIDGLQYYARRLHQLKLCAQNARAIEDDPFDWVRQSFRVIKFPHEGCGKGIDA
jgi:hypothetical protein